MKKTLLQDSVKLRKLASFFKRRQFCFELNPFMIVEKDIVRDELAGLVRRFRFVPVDTLGF